MQQIKDPEEANLNLRHLKGAELCRVKVIAYDCTPTSDGKTSRLQEAVKKAGGSWKNVAKLGEQELARLVRDDGVDILVELTGHTANNRLGVMAQRPAPVQVEKQLFLVHSAMSRKRSTHGVSQLFMVTDVRCTAGEIGSCDLSLRVFSHKRWLAALRMSHLPWHWTRPVSVDAVEHSKMTVG